MVKPWKTLVCEHGSAATVNENCTSIVVCV